MTFAPSISAPADAAPSDPFQDREDACTRLAGETDLERLERQVRVVRRFTEIALTAAEGLEQRVLADVARIEAAQTEAAQAGDAVAEPSDALDGAGAGLSLALHRLSRLARLGIALENRLIKDYRRHARGDMPELKRPAAAAATPEPEKSTEPGPDAEAAEPGEQSRESDRENLLAGFLGMLDGEDFDEASLERLYAELVAAVIAAKGEVPDWAELHEAASAVLATLSAGALLSLGAAPANDAVPKDSVAPANDTAPKSRAAPMPEPPLRLGGRGPP